MRSLKVHITIKISHCYWERDGKIAQFTLATQRERSKAREWTLVTFIFRWIIKNFAFLLRERASERCINYTSREWILRSDAIRLFSVVTGPISRGGFSPLGIWHTHPAAGANVNDPPWLFLMILICLARRDCNSIIRTRRSSVRALHLITLVLLRRGKKRRSVCASGRSGEHTTRWSCLNREREQNVKKSKTSSQILCV